MRVMRKMKLIWKKNKNKNKKKVFFMYLFFLAKKKIKTVKNKFILSNIISTLKLLIELIMYCL